MRVVLPLAGGEGTYAVFPSKIIAVGLNYDTHIAESSSLKIRGFTAETPSEPVLFNKTPNVLIGPGEAIRIPRSLDDYSWSGSARTDYEGELALIIGVGGKNIPPDEALEHVFGYTCMNDVSQRDIQNADASGWFRGKSFDSFGPIGPCVVPARLIEDPQNLSISTRLNGRTVQNSNTRNMIFPLDELVAFISRQFTLEEGDIILTGTPGGVGPLKHGDRVEVEIEGVGILENSVIDERWQAT